MNELSYSHFPGTGLPTEIILPTYETERFHAALDNFSKVFAIRSDDNVLLLVDRKMDPQVIHAIWGLAKARGASVHAYLAETPAMADIPEEVKPLLAKATFVCSSWFCSIINEFCVALRRDKGQRWVKLTHFRNINDLKTEQAAFPLEIVSILTRRTAERFPKGIDTEMRLTNPRGSDLRIQFTGEMISNLLSSNRWKGDLTASSPGAYVHYLPTHGPNIYDETCFKNNPAAVSEAEVNGVFYPQWSVGFDKPFREPIKIEFHKGVVTEVSGSSEEAGILAEILPGSRLIELGCGFNPKARRYHPYPAGPNSPGGLHFGLDLVKEADYIKKVMPNWEEPPIHVDLVDLDTTVTIGDVTLIENGFLTALRDPEVIQVASKYGEPIYLLEKWPD